MNNGPNALVASDLSKIVSIDDASKKYHESEEVKKTIKAIALIVNGYFTKHIINFVFTVKGKNAIPSKAFKNRQDAEEWLLSL